jgi:hypothetical protein
MEPPAGIPLGPFPTATGRAAPYLAKPKQAGPDHTESYLAPPRLTRPYLEHDVNPSTASGGKLFIASSLVTTVSPPVIGLCRPDSDVASGIRPLCRWPVLHHVAPKARAPIPKTNLFAANAHPLGYLGPIELARVVQYLES